MPAPAQMISVHVMFMIRVTDGNMNAMALLMNMLILVRSRFASSNLFSSCPSELNALTTRRPESLSLIMRFSLSSLSCRTLNFGRTAKNRTIMISRMTTMLRASVHVIPGESLSAWIRAPVPMTGANIAILRRKTVVCWRFWTSFVDLVMRLAVENCSNSAAE